MKHLKLFPAAILLVILGVAIFSSSNASQNSFKNKPADLSVTCPLKIHLSSGASCMVAPYTYCINGGGRVTVSTDTFTVYLNSGSTSTICVENSGHTCSNSFSYYMPSPCPTPSADTTIGLIKNGGACNCSGD